MPPRCREIAAPFALAAALAAGCADVDARAPVASPAVALPAPPPRPARTILVAAGGSVAPPRYAFVSGRDAPDGWSSSQIYLADAEGTIMGPPLREAIRILAVGTWEIVRDIPLPPPARYNISGIDFTADDQGLVFGADASDVDGSLANRHGEIFVVDLEGKRLQRLTRNAVYDGQPIVLPQ